MARATWAGAINFAGFPIHVQAFSLVTSASAKSFKTLDPDDKMPVKQLLVDHRGDEVDRAACLKGVEVSKNNYAALAPEAVEFIQSAGRSDTVEPERFPEAKTVPLHLSTGAYRLVPNPKVPGSEGPVEILWNGLIASDRAMIVPEWIPRSGGRDQLLVVTADVHGLNGNTLPFEAELQDTPEHAFEENEQAASMFEQFVELNYKTDDFAHAAYASRYDARRKEAIEKALAGEIVTAPDTTPAAPATPDLMAAMAAALATPTAKKKAPAKTRAKSKA